MHRSKKTLKLRVTGPCEGNSPVTGGFPAQSASNAETVSIWWRHQEDPVNISGDGQGVVGDGGLSQGYKFNPLLSRSAMITRHTQEHFIQNCMSSIISVKKQIILKTYCMNYISTVAAHTVPGYLAWQI